MIQKIQDTDDEIYQNFKNKFNMPMAYTHTTDQIKKLEIILQPFEKYSYTIYRALVDLINAFNNSELYSDNLPKFTEFPTFRDLTNLPEKSINTNMLNVFLKTIEDINYLNDKKIKNKYDRELQTLDFRIKKEKKIIQLEQFKNSQIELDNQKNLDPIIKIIIEKLEDSDIYTLLRNFTDNQKFFKGYQIKQIHHNIIINKIKEYPQYDIFYLVSLFRNNINLDKDLIQIFHNIIIEESKKNRIISHDQIQLYKKSLKEKGFEYDELEEGKKGEEGEEDKKYKKYYDDIYKVFESITDLVVFQRNLRYKVYMIHQSIDSSTML